MQTQRKKNKWALADIVRSTNSLIDQPCNHSTAVYSVLSDIQDISNHLGALGAPSVLRLGVPHLLHLQLYTCTL